MTDVTKEELDLRQEFLARIEKYAADLVTKKNSKFFGMGIKFESYTQGKPSLTIRALYENFERDNPWKESEAYRKQIQKKVDGQNVKREESPSVV